MHAEVAPEKLRAGRVRGYHRPMTRQARLFPDAGHVLVPVAPVLEAPEGAA